MGEASRDSQSVAGARRMGWRSACCAMFVALLTPLGGMRADTAAPAQPGSSMQEVIAMAANEVLAAQHKDHYIYLSKERSERTGGHLWTEKVVETDAGKVRFLLAEDGAPLGPEREAEER